MEMKKYIIKLNSKTYEVEMGELAGSSEYVAAPTASSAASVTAQSSQQSAPKVHSVPKSSAAGGETIISPMPGTIISVLVKVGDMVKKNQVLVVLEAMKMENEIVAPADGTILSITANKGTAVDVSEELVRIG